MAVFYAHFRDCPSIALTTNDQEFFKALRAAFITGDLIVDPISRECNFEDFITKVTRQRCLKVFTIARFLACLLNYFEGIETIFSNNFMSSGLYVFMRHGVEIEIVCVVNNSEQFRCPREV